MGHQRPLQKIKAVYDSDPVKYETLQQILLIEKSIYGSEWPKVGATLALMWLKRGLRFIQILLQSLVDDERDEDNPDLIRINITKAYEQALKRYHGWIVQKVFKRISCSTPLAANGYDINRAPSSNRFSSLLTADASSLQPATSPAPPCRV
ncbi:unnamed protein product [Leuciscus chuanchicus]